jgi:hypothetical protein
MDDRADRRSDSLAQTILFLGLRRESLRVNVAVATRSEDRFSALLANSARRIPTQYFVLSLVQYCGPISGRYFIC